MKQIFPLLCALAAVPVSAEEARELDAHEHGVGALNIAVDGNAVVMEFRAPGADIVGFEYAAESAEDRAAIDEAVATLARPLELFVFPEAAACSVTQASAELESEETHGAHGAHGDEKHADAHDEEHAHEHDDEKHADAHDDEHSEHAHEEHAEEASHTEFHAEYALTCGNPSAVSQIDFAYFGVFENARELEVQIVTASGAQAFEVVREEPALDLRGMF